MTAPTVRPAVWCAVLVGTQDGKPATMAVTVPPEHRHHVLRSNAVASLAIDNVTGGGIAARVRAEVRAQLSRALQDEGFSRESADAWCDEIADAVTANALGITTEARDADS